MSVEYNELYNTFQNMSKAAKTVQNKTRDEFTRDVIDDILEQSIEMRGELEGTGPSDDTAEAVRNSNIPQLQNSLGEGLMSILAHSGRPPEVADTFEELLKLAKRSEELVMEAEGGQETKPVLKI